MAAARTPPDALVEEPRWVGVHAFSGSVLDSVVHFQVLTMGDSSLYVWVGAAPPRLEHLAVSLRTPEDPLPVASTVLGGDGNDGVGRSIAQRITKRTGRLVICSYNLPGKDDMLGHWAQKRLMDELRAIGVVGPDAGAEEKGA